MSSENKTALSLQIKDRIVKEAKRRKSVQAIANMEAACDFFEKQGIPISVASVGRYCSGKPGGPAEQSIRNRRTFTDYISARAAEQRSVEIKPNARAVRSGDSSIDAYIATLELEASRLESDLRSLRKALPRIGSYDLETALKTGTLVINAPTGEMLSNDARSALHALLDTQNLARAGLALASTGQIIAPDQNESILLSKAQVDALRLLLK